jgi:hypothetical protein
LKTWKGLTEDKKIKSFRFWPTLYFVYEKLAESKPIEAGIISLKNLKSGFLPFNFKEDKEPQ